MKLERPEHQTREAVVAQKLADAWRCEWGRMGPYSPFDVYLMRDKKVMALVEIRTRRDRGVKTYPTILMDLDKWFTLMQCEIGLGLPAFYVVAFQDGIWSVRIGTLAVNDYRIMYRGRTDRPQAVNDLSPVVEVPSAEFRYVTSSEGVWSDEEKAG